MRQHTRAWLAAMAMSIALPALAADLATQIDSSIAPLFKAGTPGAAVIVTKDGKPVFRKAYGMADLEANVANDPAMSFRLGSITKQFTASAILLLAEQGKLSLKDDIRTYLPEFPDKGKVITIEHLLTHTSGIPSYTSQPSYVANMAKDMTVASMIASFKDLPLEFAPGERFVYNNSGYFLLGAIIEKVSRRTYAEFLALHIFSPLGMEHTAYEGKQRHKVTQVHGYSGNDGKFTPTAALSMTQPYAAGSLVSTVDDLARWDQAISSGKLLKEASWKQAFTPYKLKDGSSTNYGYGWGIKKLQGSAGVAHGGGINGFSTFALRLPAEKVYVAVLTNSDSGLPQAEMIASKAAAIAIGKPFTDFTAVTLDEKALDAFVGTYKVDATTERFVMREGSQLYMQRSGGTRVALTPYSATAFFVPNTLLDVRFGKNAQGDVNEMTVLGAGAETPNPRTSAAPPLQRTAIALAAGVFERYVGKYELQPGFVLSISGKDGKYFAQATGQPVFEIYPSSDTMFFSKIVDAQLLFERDAQGKVSQLVLLQGGRNMPGKRVE